jgi:hypothetical protein
LCFSWLQLLERWKAVAHFLEAAASKSKAKTAEAKLAKAAAKLAKLPSCSALVAALKEGEELIQEKQRQTKVT